MHTPLVFARRFKNQFFSKLFLFGALCILFPTTSCTAATKPENQKKFGNDTDYFIGLRLLGDGNENAAREKFKRCIKKGSARCAQRSAEALCTFGNLQEKNSAAENLLKLFPGEESILVAARQFSATGEINKLIQCTAGLDFTTTKNEIIRLRLEAMAKRGDSAYQTEVYRWFSECPVSTEHYQFYRDTYVHPDFDEAYQNPEEETVLSYTPEQFAINYRIASYKRNYSYTMLCSPELVQYFEDGKLEPKPQLISDFGKNYLYGSMDFVNNAMYFRELAQKYTGTPAEFYFWFYAGRLFDKAGIYYQQTKTSFESAIAAANNPSQKDNALWYLLNTSLNFSMDSIISSIGTYSREWSDSEYFEDFFEQLVTALLAAGRWDEFGRIYKAIDSYASDFTTAQFAYLYGRLIREGLATGNELDAVAAFKRACQGGTSVYYKSLAAYQLGLWQDPLELQKVLCAPTCEKAAQLTDEASAPKIDSDFETLLMGYAYFGFPELIYPEWQKNQGQNLSTETNFYLSDFLAKCADKENHDYYVQSLRIAARAQRNATEQIKREQLAQVYPRFYKDCVERYCKEYKLGESTMYALIRSESFFDADVMSSAGAVGLTQLMELTASDIARRLKVQDYSLTDPETNIRFGTYYLSTLIARCENSPLLGFFSYNAGITRVRRWLQSSLIEFGKKSNMPLDLFLETVPFAETREYGRKLISATIVYNWLDSSANFENTVSELLK